MVCVHDRYNCAETRPGFCNRPQKVICPTIAVDQWVEQFHRWTNAQGRSIRVEGFSSSTLANMSLDGAGPHSMDSSDKMALITSDFDAMRSMSTKWP